MLNFIFQMSDAKVFILMVLATVSLSLFLIFINKNFIFYRLKYEDNTASASISALIGITYGVLVGFICLYLLNNQDRAVEATLNEGVAAADIYRDSHWLKEPIKHQIQTELKSYLTTVINIEWPEMTAGKDPDKENGYRIDKMANAIMMHPLINPKDNFVVSDIMQSIKELYKARQQRIAMNQVELSPEIWAVILLSTILLIVINYAFRVSYPLHTFTTTAFAIMAASILFLLVTIDRPFQGEFIVEPDALRAVLDSMNVIPETVARRLSGNHS